MNKYIVLSLLERDTVGRSAFLNVFRPFHERLRPFYDQKSSETVMKRPGTLGGLKGLQNHGHASKTKDTLCLL